MSADVNSRAQIERELWGAADAVESYIGRIRNAAKRDYARRYVSYISQAALEGPEPERGELSYMGAQAVRMSLYQILGLQTVNPLR